ncbi:MAG: DUF1624 domain-containing protein [Pirellulaceae bacterium]|nr:DUF1624 domain-containing protein [Pirellulaceae bacterium]
MRYSSIDILRTLAIAVMVIVHFEENLSGYIPPIAGLGAPLFAFLSGMSYRLWVQGQEARQASDEDISKVSIRRGLFVFGVGFAFNILVWLPEDTFNWDVLTFIGAALLLLNQVRHLPLLIPILIGILSLLLSPALRALADWPDYWVEGYFDPDMTLSDVLVGFLVTGYFPMFPWITFSLAGFVTASLIMRPADEPPPPLRPPLLLGAALVTVSAIAVLLTPYLPPPLTRYLVEGWSMYPPTVPYVAGTLGMALILVAGCSLAIDRNPRSARYGRALEVAKMFSRHAFTIYLVHHFVHIWPLWIYAVIQGQEPTAYWKNALPTTVSLPLALLFLLACYLVLRRLGPDSRYGVESWMRWLCD